MRMGIMGGTLDPVHNGHLAIADAARTECGLDGVILLPAGDPPHKTAGTDKLDRLSMARLAARDKPYMTVSADEVARTGTTYTVDTLRAWSRAQPDTQWVYIVGADTVAALDSWREFSEVAKLCEFAAVCRPGIDRAETLRRVAELESRYGARIALIDFTGPDISSTEVRRRVAENADVSEMLPEGVATYIRENGLYLCAYGWRETERMLERTLKPGRYDHTLGTMETAMRLARRWGADVQRARLAGLLHDCAKSMPYEEMVKAVRAGVPDADEAELSMEPVLHAPAGMLLAREVYGVKDAEVLSAIRRHTLGGTGMTLLEKIIFVSDFIEPGRRPFPGLNEARDMAMTDLTAATKLCARMSSEFVITRGGAVHPRTAQMIEE